MIGASEIGIIVGVIVLALIMGSGIGRGKKGA
jgi:hypothetical protein